MKMFSLLLGNSIILLMSSASVVLSFLGHSLIIRLLALLSGV